MAVVDLASREVTAQVATGSAPTSVAVLPDGRRALVTNAGDGTVRVLELA